jgi:hypothetical protein
VTEQERANRNPAPEICEFDLRTARELHVADLVLFKAYILRGQRNAASLNYMGPVDAGVFGKGHHFHGPRADVHAFLAERPDGSGTLEDGRGVKVTIYEYAGPDA